MTSGRIKILISGFIRHNHLLKVQGTRIAKQNHLAAELSRFTHSIEKGLTISEPRLGFGHDKQRKMMDLISILENSPSSYHREVCEVALDALSDYLAFHDLRNFSDDFCVELKEFVVKHQISHDEKMGGVVLVKKSELDFDQVYIENFIKSRHSIRDFTNESVDEELLKKAMKLAQYAPSACNRQGVRAYVLSKEESLKLAQRLTGIGGFADNAARLILITGKTSAYRKDETYQYIVSASIYAAYLSLTLHAYGLGGCIVQRQVVWSREWEHLRKTYDIQEDEQLCLIIAVGNLKEEFYVPVSHRLNNEEMIRFI